jgi:MFS family permease
MKTNPARRGARYIVGHYFMTNLGYFGLLSTLVVTLNAASFDAARIAVLIMIFTLTTKIAKIPLAPWLDRMAAATSVLIGCTMATLGFFVLYSSDGLYLTAAALALAGTGISINALASKQLAAAASDVLENRARLFSVINIGINVASAVAAPLALSLAGRGLHGYVLLGIAAAYSTAGVATFLNFSRLGLKRPHTGVPSLRAYIDMLRIPGLQSFMLINFFGWLLYGQLFNVLALHVSKTLNAPGKLGWLYTLNAMLVVFLQLPVTHLAGSWNSGRQMQTVRLAYLTFTLAFVVPFLVPGYAGAATFVLLFTLAEMMFVPSVDVLLLALIGQESRAVGYSVLSISTALGESIGGGMGVAAYRWLTDHGHGDEFWLGMAGLSLAFMAITWQLETSSAGLRSLAPSA